MAPSRYAVTTSTTCWHSMGVGLRVNSFIGFSEVLLQRRADLRAGPVQKHSLIGLRDLQGVTRVLGIEALEVAHRDDGLLHLGQSRDRLAGGVQRLRRAQRELRLVLPAAWRRRPPALAREAVGVDRGLVGRRLA